ncbi:MAG: hypothetical protein ACR2L3_02720, partial [Actinomycetota bacterium]
MSRPSSRSGSRRSKTPVQLDTLVVHHAELGTKGKNRGFFEHILRTNLERALTGTGVVKVRCAFGRITASFPLSAPEVLPAPGAHVSPGSQPPIMEAARRAAQVFGVAYVGVGVHVGDDFEAIKRAALNMIDGEPE